MRRNCATMLAPRGDSARADTPCAARVFCCAAIRPQRRLTPPPPARQTVAVSLRAVSKSQRAEPVSRSPEPLPDRFREFSHPHLTFSDSAVCADSQASSRVQNGHSRELVAPGLLYSRQDDAFLIARETAMKTRLISERAESTTRTDDGATESSFERWLIAQLEALEERMDAFVTRSSLRRHLLSDSSGSRSRSRR